MNHTHLSNQQERPYGLLRLYQLEGAPFRSSRFVVRPGQTTVLDQHMVRELWFVLRGNGTMLQDGEALAEIGADSTVLFDSLEPHQVRNIGECELEILSVWWQP